MEIILIVAVTGVGIVFAAAVTFWLKHGSKDQGEQKISQLKGALQGRNLQVETLINSISDGIIVIDTDFRINIINNAAAQMTGWNIEEALGIDSRVALKIIKDPKENTIYGNEEHPFSQVIVKKQKLIQSMQIIDRDNKKIFVSLAISPMVLPENNQLIGAIAIFRNITKEKNEEQQRADFISTASHEMRTPVAAIEGYLALAMNERVSKIDQKAREYLEKAHWSTQHLGQLFQDLLTSSKAEDGRLTSHPQVIEMGEFIRQLSEDLKFGAEKKRLEVKFLVTAGTENPGMIDASGGQRTVMPLYYTFADPDRMREVVTNLFDNAVKYTPSGHVALGIAGNDQVVQIKISDTGAGIPKEDLPHLFQKFYRVDNSVTRSVGGSGLGLFICKKIVELYNGQIWAESEEGKGSKFFINLPRLTTEKANQMKAGQLS